MKVLVTDAAWDDMLAIARVIQTDSPKRAETFLEELYQACQGIGEMPLAYPLTPGHEATGIRRRVCGNYLIFYRIADHQVDVLHVLHGARDYERMIFRDEK